MPVSLPRHACLVAVLCFSQTASAQSSHFLVTGSVLDPSGHPVPQAHVQASLSTGISTATITNQAGVFSLPLSVPGFYTLQVQSSAFATFHRTFQLDAASTSLILQFQKLATAQQDVIVNADLSDLDITSPDPSQKVMVREELLDANPGRPGAPISIPGLPIETASGGIKAPQYFAPGVAGDHGEPIAQYLAVGSYLLPNNLSANAHGNGYADPNIFVSSVLGSVSTDAGAFNVLEGNHALNLAATYGLRPSLRRFATLTGDYRDIDLTVGFASADPDKKAWLALEANYGNGLMLTLEHRKQFKFNGFRLFTVAHHALTFFADGYYGVSHEGNLVPIGSGIQVNDTVDRRQQDQTHTAILAFNDQWTPTPKDTVAFSAFFRTYNLSLFSDFGEGLIRQSEFRTVIGAEARETRTVTPWLQVMAGLLFNQDDIRNDNLDHYLSSQPFVYGPFLKVLANNITLRELAPYTAAHAELGNHLRVYLGIRGDQVQFLNTDKQQPTNSFNIWKGFVSPKATLAWSPGTGPLRWLPSASLSIGQAFFTQDPRITVAPSTSATGASAFANPFERSHAAQLTLDKFIGATEARLTLSRTTETATLAKIDPDNGTADDLGPGTIKFLTFNLRHQFTFGSLQGIVSKANARLQSFNGLPGSVTPEAPRTIFDILATLDTLPLKLHARAEYEYVGHKFLDAGNPDHPAQFEAIPVGETRLALVRSFLQGRLETGIDALIARGYTGQTTETFNPAWTIANSRTLLPYCAPGSGPSGLPSDFDCGTVERAVGIRMVSFVGGSVSYRFPSPK